MLIESSERQVQAMCDVLAGDGLEPAVLRSDDLGATVVTGRRHDTGW